MLTYVCFKGNIPSYRYVSPYGPGWVSPLFHPGFPERWGDANSFRFSALHVPTAGPLATGGSILRAGGAPSSPPDDKRRRPRALPWMRMTSWRHVITSEVTADAGAYAFRNVEGATWMLQSWRQGLLKWGGVWGGDWPPAINGYII